MSIRSKCESKERRVFLSASFAIWIEVPKGGERRPVSSAIGLRNKRKKRFTLCFCYLPTHWNKEVDHTSIRSITWSRSILYKEDWLWLSAKSKAKGAQQCQRWKESQREAVVEKEVVYKFEDLLYQSMASSKKLRKTVWVKEKDRIYGSKSERCPGQ